MSWTDILEPFDWGRQAVTNAGEGIAGLAGGDFSRDNLAKVIPAGAGALAGLLTGGAAALPVGALTAALVQGGGKALNPGAMTAMSTNDLVAKLGGDPDSTWQNIGMHVATDPFTYAGLGWGGSMLKGGKAARTAAAAGSGAEAGAEALGAAGSRAGDLANARRGIARLTYNPETMLASERSGAALSKTGLADVESKLRPVWNSGTGGASGIAKGDDLSWFATGEIPKDLAGREAARRATRHELYHSLTGRAALEGDTLGLTPLQRMAAKYKRTAVTGPKDLEGYRSAMSRLIDETGAHAAEYTSPMSQALRGADFLFGFPGSDIDRAHYLAQLARESTDVANLYKRLGYVMPTALVGGGALNLGAVGYGGYRALRSPDQPQEPQPASRFYDDTKKE